MKCYLCGGKIDVKMHPSLNKPVCEKCRSIIDRNIP